MTGTTLRIEQTNLSSSNYAITSNGDVELGTLFASTYKQIWNKATNGLFRTGASTIYGDSNDIEGRGLIAIGKNSNSDTQTNLNYGYTACSNNVIVMQDLYNGLPIDQFAIVLNGGGAGLKFNQQRGFPLLNIDRATGNLTSKVLTGSSVLDQSFGSRNATSGASNPWQTVTAGVSGILRSVAIHNSSGLTASGYTVKIFNGSGVGGVLLASEAGPSIPDNNWGTITFTTPPYINSGAVFTIQVYDGSYFGWSINTGGGYSGGSFMGGTMDALFQTYMDSGYSLTANSTALTSTHPYIKANGINLNTSTYQSMETITGANASITAGPHKWIYTSSSSTYPIFQQLNWQQDNISLNFDCYYDGSNFKSSDSGSNFQIYKANDRLSFNYSSGIAQGSNITLLNALNFNTSGQATLGTGTASFTNDAAGGCLQVIAGTAGGSWTGRIVAGGPNNRWVCGELNGIAYCGGHNAALNAWTDVRTDSYWGFGTDPSEKMHIYGNIRINSDSTYNYGLILYNTTYGNYWTISNPYNGSNYMYFYYDGNWRVTINPSTGAYSSSSDRRLKKNIESLTGALDIIDDLSPRYFVMNDDPAEIRKCGLIHDEVLTYFPEVCTWNKKSVDSDEMYGGLDYAGCSVLAIAGIKEQQLIINELKDRISALEILHQ